MGNVGGLLLDTAQLQVFFLFSCQAVDRNNQLKGFSAFSEQAQAKATEWKSRLLFTHRISGCCETLMKGRGPCMRG